MSSVEIVGSGYLFETVYGRNGGADNGSVGPTTAIAIMVKEQVITHF